MKRKRKETVQHQEEGESQQRSEEPDRNSGPLPSRSRQESQEISHRGTSTPMVPRWPVARRAGSYMASAWTGGNRNLPGVTARSSE